MNEAETPVSRMVRITCETYKEPSERAALRCALGDASALCDSIAHRLELEHRTKKGRRTTKLGRHLAAIARVCGDDIWAMRERIKVQENIGT